MFVYCYMNDSIHYMLTHWLIDEKLCYYRNYESTLYDGLSEGSPDAYVKIYDGGCTSCPVLGTFCGSDYIVPVTSTGNEMFIVFKTDKYMSRSGFQLEYKSEGMK